MNSAKLIQWLYLPDAMVPLISRLVGLISLPVGFVVWFYAGDQNSIYPQPFNVPTWRFGTYLLPVPLPPEPLNIFVFALFAAACVLLLAGKWHRSVYLYMASVLAYYTAREFFACCLHWVLLDFLFLVALSFRSKPEGGPSPTRRLIQITLATCYLFGVLQKLFYPDFWQGISLEATFYDGYGVTPPFKHLFIEHQLPMSFWSASAIFLMASETFIGIGLFFQRTRIAACVLGAILHGGILVMMDFVIAIFSIEMWTGYLAFFEGRKKAPQAAAAPSDSVGAAAVEAEPDPIAAPAADPGKFMLSPRKTVLSLAFIALLVLMPLRIYYLPGPPADLITLFERTPWGFGMFLMRQQVEQLDIAFDDEQGKTHEVEATGRMKTASNDNELIAIAAYVLKNHAQAKSIRVNDVVVVNERRRILRTLIWDNPSAAASSPKISVTSAGEYCRGAANRSPESGRHP